MKQDPRRGTLVRGPVALFGALAALVLAFSCRQTTSSPQGWRSGTGPVVPHDTFPADCSLCHVTGDWHTIKKDFRFDHEKETGYALAGAHAQAQCLRCHNDRGPVKSFEAKGCAGCHSDPHLGELGRNCKTCHDEQNWQPRGQIAKRATTRFPLTGARMGTACFQCHPGAAVGNFKGADVRCVSCHLETYNKTTSPNHVTAGFPMECETCHTTSAWRGVAAGASFAHPATFPLTGGHAAPLCTACHPGAPNGNFGGASTACVSCHLNDFNRTTNPNHAASGFSTQCQQCHTTSTWAGAIGGPSQHTPFIITSGPHAKPCIDCHLTPGNFTSFSCIHHHHTQTKTAQKHVGVAGYVWSSPACFNCHPTGKYP